MLYKPVSSVNFLQMSRTALNGSQTHPQAASTAADAYATTSAAATSALKRDHATQAARTEPLKLLVQPLPPGLAAAAALPLVLLATQQ